MDAVSCNTCIHFRQHYALNNGKIFRVYCGHCTCGKVRRKRPDAKACENYLLSESTENTFATREYLSKALLDYILRMELLPEINDIEQR